jgi:hypothetical protein
MWQNALLNPGISTPSLAQFAGFAETIPVGVEACWR